MNERASKVTVTDEEQPWFVRPREAERLTGLDDSTIRLAITNGELRAHKFKNRGWLIERKELWRWVMAYSQPNIPSMVIPADKQDLIPIMDQLHQEDLAMRAEDV